MKRISLVVHLVLVSSCGLFIVGEQIQCYKYLVLNMHQRVKTKVINANLVITQNKLKPFRKRKIEIMQKKNTKIS